MAVAKNEVKTIKRAGKSHDFTPRWEAKLHFSTGLSDRQLDLSCNRKTQETLVAIEPTDKETQTPWIKMSTIAMYYFQGDLGESMEYPNAFVVRHLIGIPFPACDL